MTCYMISNNLLPLAVAEARMRHGNPQPNEPSKPSKGAFEGFEGDLGECFSWTQRISSRAIPGCQKKSSRRRIFFAIEGAEQGNELFAESEHAVGVIG